MIKIYSGGEKITYTKGDTFEISVSSAEGFGEESTLRFQVAKNEMRVNLAPADAYVFEIDTPNIELDRKNFAYRQKV